MVIAGLASQHLPAAARALSRPLEIQGAALFVPRVAIAVSLTYTPNQLDATVSFFRIDLSALVLFTYMVANASLGL